ncbi:MAG: Paraquat-inducible protein [Myxococcaceae bacterium]|nr:Paraquat-inducible protein [Myxococcaceae bacterium]
MGTTHSMHLLECSHCGLVQRSGQSRPSHVVVCARCESRLPGAPSRVPKVVVVCACVAVLLLTLAVDSPVFEMHLLGRYVTAGLLSGPQMLAQRGMPELSLVVFLTLFIAPFVHLSILALALVGSHMREPRRFLFMPLGLLDAARLWSMTDVFLLATLVCYVRLQAWAHVQVGGAIIALIALTLVTLASELALDPRAMWQHMPWQREPRPSTHGPKIGCSWCELVNHAHEGEPCARCGRRLHARKHKSLVRAASLLLAATFLCIPANVLPVMDMIRFGRADSNTIFSGVVELTQHDLWGLAVLIFVASIVIPLIKIVALATLLFLTARRRPEHLKLRTHTFRFVRLIGRWSLVDVFAVTILVSLVHMGIMASVLPRYGAVAFCGVVILTMLAAEAFDPRLMWDAAGLNDSTPLEQKP